MIRAETTVAEATRDRVQAWLKAERARRVEIAKDAGVNEKTLRLAIHGPWDPRVKTLAKLEAVMPKKRGRAA